MKKYLSCLIFLCGLILSNVSVAKSLDEALSAQVQLEVSPVSVNGKHIAVDPAGVCGALGYTRVVSYSTEPCEDGEVLYAYSSFQKSSGVAVLLGGVYKEGICDKLTKRLASVTCAR